jgi:hypothetical protein
MQPACDVARPLQQPLQPASSQHTALLQYLGLLPAPGACTTAQQQQLYTAAVAAVADSLAVLSILAPSAS